VAPAAGLICYGFSMRVSGRVLRFRDLYLRKAGSEARAAVLAALHPDTQALFETGFLETRWYPYELLVEITTTTDRVLGTGDGAICFDIGRFSCDAGFNTAYRLLFKFGNLGWLLDRASKAWGSQYDEGEMKVLRRDVGTEVLVELSGVPEPSRAHCLAVKGWMWRAAELVGEENFTIDETCRARGDEACRFAMRWK
jgi:hypothetical protein